jgi:hypothetical protein
MVARGSGQTTGLVRCVIYILSLPQAHGQRESCELSYIKNIIGVKSPWRLALGLTHHILCISGLPGSVPTPSQHWPGRICAMPSIPPALLCLGESCMEGRWSQGWGTTFLIVAVFQGCVWARGSTPRNVSSSFRIPELLFWVQTKCSENILEKEAGEGLRPTAGWKEGRIGLIQSSSLCFPSRESSKTHHLGEAQFHGSKGKSSDHLVPGGSECSWV